MLSDWDLYLNEKKKLLSKYDKVLKSKELPSYFTKEVIVENKNNLTNDKFIVSICGQMKTGKSTLINSFLFGDTVLPHALSTMTANLSIMHYAEVPRFEVVYYTPEEWKQVESDYKPKDSSSIEFENALRIISEYDLSIEDIIKKKSESFSDLKELKKYAAVSQEGGLFSILVKYINIYYPNDLLKHITIVDTPGTNDPNKVREEITVDWLLKSNAVLYVTYAGQAFTDFDYEFMNKYLLHVEPKCMILAVNKCDVAKNIEVIENWLNNKLLKNFKLESIKRNFNKSTPRVFVSALGELIRRMQEEKIDLSDEYKWQLKEFEKDKDYTKRENNKIFKLVEVIQKKLVDEKGKRILESNENFLRSIFEYEQRDVVKKLDIIRLTEEDYKKTKNELEKELNSIESEINKLESKSIAFESNREDVTNKLHRRIDDELRPLSNKILEEFKLRLSEVEYSELKLNAPWILKDSFNKYSNSIQDVSELITKDFNARVENEIDDFIIELSEYQSVRKVFRESYFTLSEFDIRRDFGQDVKSNLSTDNIKEMISEVTSFWGNLFKTETSKAKIVRRICRETEEIIDNRIESVCGKLKAIVKKQTDNLFKNQALRARELLIGREKEVRKIMENQKNKAEKVKSLVEQKNVLMKKKTEIEKLEHSILD